MIETIVVVYELPKRTQEKLLGTIIQSIFCAQSRASIRLNFWKFSESRYPGALSPVLENFRPAFSPDPTDSPWVSQDERSSRPKCEIISWGTGGLYTFLIFFFCHGSRFLFRPADQNNTKANYHVMYVGNILFKSVLNKWHNRLFSTHFKPSTRSLKNFLTSRQIRQSNNTFPKRWEFLIKTKCNSSLFNLDSVQFWYELNPGGGVLLGILGGECAAQFSKSWPYFRPNNVIFQTRFPTRPLKSIPVFKPGL